MIMIMIGLRRAGNISRPCIRRLRGPSAYSCSAHRSTTKGAWPASRSTGTTHPRAGAAAACICRADVLTDGVTARSAFEVHQCPFFIAETALFWCLFWPQCPFCIAETALFWCLFSVCADGSPVLVPAQVGTTRTLYVYGEATKSKTEYRVKATQ